MKPVHAQIYLAPMEGITTYIYRNAQAAVYGRLDKYFTPFLEPHEKRSFKKRELQEILQENNKGLFVVPQILTNRAEGFLELSASLYDMGYREVNLNLGCPSGTVVAKKKGSGFLAYPRELDRFLEEIFSGTDLAVSVKTRIGKEDPEEFYPLLEIFSKYPLTELIIHPRVQTDFYQNRPNLEVFARALFHTKIPVCYNGDLFTRGLCETFTDRFPEIDTLMMGRGLIRNPALVRELQGGKRLEKEELQAFHDDLLAAYETVLSGDRPVLFKMKELWFYMGSLFEDGKKQLKAIKKAQSCLEYKAAAENLFSTARFII